MGRPLDLTAEDLARYRTIIGGIEMSDEQKDEVILIVRDIMKSFVQQAFGLDPTSLAMKGELTNSFQDASSDGILLLFSQQEPKEPSP